MMTVQSLLTFLAHQEAKRNVKPAKETVDIHTSPTYIETILDERIITNDSN